MPSTFLSNDDQYTNTIRPRSLCASLVFGLTLASGCTSQTALDKHIQKLIDESASNIGADSPEVNPRNPSVDGSQKKDSLQIQPSTPNPAASELTYTPSDADRDVKTRLERFAVQSGVLTSPGAPAIRTLSLNESLRVSQQTGREYLAAQDDYIISVIRLLLERHLWGPRFFDDVTASIRGTGDEGDYQHVAGLVNSLRVTQRLPSGGSVEAAAIVQLADQLREQASDEYVQSTRLVLRGDIPLLRGAGTVAREDLIQAERNLVYQARTFERFRREFLVEIATDYFALLESQSGLVNQEVQLKSLERLATATAERVKAGRREAFEADLAANRVLQAQADLAFLRERLILQLDRFKLRLGISIDEPIGLDPAVFNLPEPEIDPAEASRFALLHRLDLQNQRDQLDDSRRAVANARNDLLPDLNLAGSIEIPTDSEDDTGGLDPDVRELNYNASATLSLPLDRRQEQLRLKQSLIALERSQRDLSRAKDDIVISVRAALRNIEQARFQLNLAEQQVAINTRRLDGQRLKADEVDPQTVVDAENDKLASENQRDRALTALRNAILNYLLESDQLRVTRQGELMLLPGMSDSAETSP